jgi:hypothetical protein
MTLLDQLLQWGIDLKLTVAGFAGGAVREFFFGAGGGGWKAWSNWTASIIGGGLTATYAGAQAAHLTGFSEPFSGFAVGAAAIFVAQGITSFAKAWSSKQQGDFKNRSP